MVAVLGEVRRVVEDDGRRAMGLGERGGLAASWPRRARRVRAGGCLAVLAEVRVEGVVLLHDEHEVLDVRGDARRRDARVGAATRLPAGAAVGVVRRDVDARLAAERLPCRAPPTVDWWRRCVRPCVGCRPPTAATTREKDKQETPQHHPSRYRQPICSSHECCRVAGGNPLVSPAFSRRVAVAKRRTYAVHREHERHCGSAYYFHAERPAEIDSRSSSPGKCLEFLRSRGRK